jgi:predicted RNA-binding Zn ribbon-like protein
MSMTVSSPPHDLQLVIDFVNTLDLEQGTDELDTPASLVAWLDDRKLLDGSVQHVDEAHHAQSLELREALRAAIVAHNGGDRDSGAARKLERTAEGGQLSVHFEADGSVTLGPRAEGVVGALARLLVPIAHAAADGSWQRVKGCAADDCRWAFYDQSRNHSARWCDMAVCGNRTKVRTYRTKRTSDID